MGDAVAKIQVCPFSCNDSNDRYTGRGAPWLKSIRQQDPRKAWGEGHPHMAAELSGGIPLAGKTAGDWERGIC